MPADYIGLYGNIKIPKGYCSSCEGYAFVIDNKLACCDKEYTVIPKKFKRISEPEQKRKRLKRAEQHTILTEQDYRCFYCDRAFGTTITFPTKQSFLKIEWDHLVPFKYQQNNHKCNVVAACQFCNAWKRALVFQTVEEARIYLYDCWKKAETA